MWFGCRDSAEVHVHGAGHVIGYHLDPVFPVPEILFADGSDFRSEDIRVLDQHLV